MTFQAMSSFSRPHLNISAYKHCEKYWLETVQVVPATQTVEPAYPSPPHCPYFATVGPLGTLVAVGAGAVATGVVGSGLDPPLPPDD